MSSFGILNMTSSLLLALLHTHLPPPSHSIIRYKYLRTSNHRPPPTPIPPFRTQTLSLPKHPDLNISNPSTNATRDPSQSCHPNNRIRNPIPTHPSRLPRSENPILQTLTCLYQHRVQVCIRRSCRWMPRDDLWLVSGNAPN